MVDLILPLHGEAQWVLGNEHYSSAKSIDDYWHLATPGRLTFHRNAGRIWEDRLPATIHVIFFRLPRFYDGSDVETRGGP